MRTCDGKLWFNIIRKKMLICIFWVFAVLIITYQSSSFIPAAEPLVSHVHGLPMPEPCPSSPTLCLQSCRNDTKISKPTITAAQQAALLPCLETDSTLSPPSSSDQANGWGCTAQTVQAIALGYTIPISVRSEPQSRQPQMLLAPPVVASPPPQQTFFALSGEGSTPLLLPA